MSQPTPADIARAVRQVVDLTRAEACIVQLMLEAGPDQPIARETFAKPDSKSGDVIFSRLRSKFAARGIAVMTVFPNGVAATGREALKFRTKATGYALAQDDFARVVALAMAAGLISQQGLAA